MKKCINHKMSIPKPFKIYLYCISLSLILMCTNAISEIVKKIEIKGNKRISNETITMFSQVKLDDDLDDKAINKILKNLYETNFFEDVQVSLISNSLSILVKENPIIENISFMGIKSKTLKEKITKNLNLKSRTSYNEIILKKDISIINSALKNQGYYFSKINVGKIELEDNKIDLNFNIELGNKAKIKKISFIGDKKFKDGKLKSLIVSEEYKFWKFISGRKYLNEDMINFDKRLLKNFYLNKGYYQVNINSSFAKLIDDDEFELVYNINTNKKFFFGELSIQLPSDFDNLNYQRINYLFSKMKDEPYSLNRVSEILDEIDLISLNEQYQSVKSSVNEVIADNRINLNFKIEETKKFVIERINIFGNNITRENVIRNQFIIDEGDTYNEILAKKNINEVKSLNFFKNVTAEVIEGSDINSKIINLTVEEKPTGELSAGAGFGTSGEVIEFSIRENNYLGKGLGVDAGLSLGTEKITGKFNVRNRNYNDTDKSINYGIQISETDKLTNFGYKSTKIGGSIGTTFEYLQDFNLGLQTTSFVENIDTNSNASSRQKSQKGDYFDTYLNIDLDYDKRNQKYKTSDGFRSFYSVGLPLVSERNTLNNYYNLKLFSELYENNVSTFSLSLSSATSITGDDVKLSERLYIPSNKLRGFQRGKIGPKDGNDFIGGNYYALINMSSTLPQVLPNAQNVDVITFLDMANLWGVDNESLNDGNEIRSAVGLGIDWFTPVGPLTFSLAAPLTKSSTDRTETFRFNIGTSF